MSEAYEQLVDVEVSVKEAPAAAKKVLARLRELGLIAGRLNKRCVLGESGYPAGPAIAKYCRFEKDFVELTNSGVETFIGRHFNVGALVDFHGLDCPACYTTTGPYEKRFGDAITRAVAEWTEQTGKAELTCPACKKKIPFTQWKCYPDLGFGNLSFTVWNWPQLDGANWKIDIPGIVAEVTGHKIVRTSGRV